MRQKPMTACIKCGKPIVLQTRHLPHEHPVQQLLKTIVPKLCATCRMRSKRPMYR